jgi:hypothetical protein
MLVLLRSTGKLPERKTRLFAVACCRRIWPLLKDERSRVAVEVAERLADGLCSGEELDSAITQALDLYEEEPTSRIAAASLLTVDFPLLAHKIAHEVAKTTALAQQDTKRASRENARLLREIFGPLPFRIVTLPPSVRTWNNGLIKRLAEQAYQHRLLTAGHLDPDRLAVLSDALEDAGADAELVEYLRGPGPHVRGCFVLDHLLGKE